MDVFQCSSSCGEGWQRRQVLCHDESGPSDTCDGEQKPVERQSCDAGPCPAWKYGEWTQVLTACENLKCSGIPRKLSWKIGLKKSFGSTTGLQEG